MTGLCSCLICESKQSQFLYFVFFKGYHNITYSGGVGLLFKGIFFDRSDTFIYKLLMITCSIGNALYTLIEVNPMTKPSSWNLF